ncbi:uncharacterized protein LOC113296293 [Papaver somniferum]|uniref:uncharacterized protein LOC113296293 n=1 Tax=Papaver somniferum TaxID=3469 RepID=UPI000E6F7D7C|nr:uncharacterized protein LOC113296293 [Papaver somniferum]
MGDPVDPNHIVAPSKILTYADRLKGRKELPKTSVDLSSLPNPTLKDGKPSIEIPNDLYPEGCALWKFSLIGRLDFKELNFSNEDKVKILQAEQWVVAQQKLNLMEWFPSFDADKQRSSRSTAWVKFPGLPMEFWIEKTLLAMGKTLGSPIVFDKRTLAHEYGHFASVLIDIDFAELKSDDINVTVGGREFCQPFEILKRPKFCSKCSIIGHSDGECRKKTRGEAVKAPKVAADLQQAIVLVNKQQHHENNAGTEWKEDRRKKKGKTAPSIPFVPEKITHVGEGTSNNVADNVLCINDTVELEQQLQDSLAQSEAVLRMASAEVEKHKQAILTHSILASKARIDITSSSTPLCNALEETSEFVSNNKFNILSDKAGNDVLVFSKLGELTKQGKRQQVIDMQNKLNALTDQDQDSLSDSDETLGIRARKESVPKSSSNSVKQLNLNNKLQPRV